MRWDVVCPRFGTRLVSFRVLRTLFPSLKAIFDKGKGIEVERKGAAA